MGNPLLDISANVPMSLLEKYGLSPNNAVLAEEKHQPLYKELVDNFPVEYIAGGATQNTIRVAQWALPAGSTAYAGCIGKDDAFGEQMKTAMKNDGVEPLYMEDASTPTGSCGVLVTDGERSLVANLQAANNYKIDHAKTPEITKAIEDASFYYSAGFFLTVSPDTMMLVAEHAAANNKVYMMNLSAPFLIDFFGEPMAKVIEYADFVFANESEAEAYGKKAGWCTDGSDLASVALKLSALPKKNGSRCRTVVFTQGSSSTLVAHNGVVTEYAVTPLAKDKLVDTNGAGDAFCGGFIALLMQGQPLKECVEAGHATARAIIQESGCKVPAFRFLM